MITEKVLSDEQRICKREILFQTMVINNNMYDTIRKKTASMISNKERYRDVSHVFPNVGFQWWIVAVLHEMECSQNFNKYLGNGQDWNKVTTITPIGRGPFNSFVEGAVDAIKLKGLQNISDWRMGNLLYVLEKFNGLGYALVHGVNSPYIWAGSNHYLKGKYVKDGMYDENTVSAQIGIALLLKHLDLQGELTS